MAEFRLEKKKNTPSAYLGDHTLLFAGGKKCGKTSLAIEFDDAFVLEFEPGNADHLECHSEDINDYEKAKKVLNFLGQNPYFCKTLVIDEVGALHYMCEQYAREALNKPEIKKSDYDVWNIVKRVFTNYIQALQALPCGKIYTCHQEWRTVELRSGRKVSFLQEALTDGCKKVMDIYTKINGFIKVESNGERVLQIEGDDEVKASNGFHNNFLQEDGTQITKIPLGKDPKTAYRMLNLAWDNKLTIKNNNVILREEKSANVGFTLDDLD